VAGRRDGLGTEAVFRDRVDASRRGRSGLGHEVAVVHGQSTVGKPAQPGRSTISLGQQPPTRCRPRRSPERMGAPVKVACVRRLAAKSGDRRRRSLEGAHWRRRRSGSPTVALNRRGSAFVTHPRCPLRQTRFHNAAAREALFAINPGAAKHGPALMKPAADLTPAETPLVRGAVRPRHLQLQRGNRACAPSSSTGSGPVNVASWRCRAWTARAHGTHVMCALCSASLAANSWSMGAATAANRPQYHWLISR
jgi:hypothetical protein